MKPILVLFTSLLFYGCVSSDTSDIATTPATGENIAGKKEGEWKTYYTNGKLATIENYYHDTLNGPRLSFGTNGIVKGKSFYKMGIKVDSSKMYFSNGKPNLEEWKDSNGKTQGLFKVYHHNGQLSQVGYMKDNYLDDTSKTFFDNGQLKSIEFYKNGKKEGTWTYFSKEGNLIATKVYLDDILISTQD